MTKEFLSADVFVLPTLAEGSAGVIYEALAAGVPIVTTRSAGSVITNGVEGLIVPERDPLALAEAIQSVIENRNLREAMALASKKTSARYTEAAWSGRLCEVLQS